MKNSSKTALGAMATAIGTVFMLLSSALPFFEYAVPAAASFLVVFMQAETDKKWAFGVYAATSLLGAFVVPNKEAMAIYIVLFGIYPILKSFFDKLPKALSYIIKGIYFVFVIVATYYVLMKFFGIASELTKELTKFTLPLLLILGLAAFFLFDRAMMLLEIMYMKKYHKTVSGLFKRK